MMSRNTQSSPSLSKDDIIPNTVPAKTAAKIPMSKRAIMLTLPFLVLCTLFYLLSLIPASTASQAPRCNLPSLIRASQRPGFDWRSLTALSLAQCMQQQRSPTPPFRNSCIFYTAHSKADAVLYGALTNKTTIYDVYSPHHFNVSLEPARTWKRQGHLRDLFKVTSKAYAISCSGDASLVLPEGVKDDEVCRESIWVTDEYEAIRNGESGIVLPILRVTRRWVKPGVYSWFVNSLDAMGISEAQELTLKRRRLDRQAAQRILDLPTQLSEAIVQKVAALKDEWAWDVIQDGMVEDLWALRSGMCGR